MKTKIILTTLGFLAGLSSLPADVIDINYRYGTDNALVTNYTGVDQAFLLLNSNAAGQGNYNTGGYNGMLVGRSNARLGIIAFDLSSLQGEVDSITSAQLTFFRTGTATDQDFTISMYEVYGTNAGWNQGTGTGAAVGPDNSVTYLNQNYSSVGGENVAWENAIGTPVGSFLSAYNPSLLDSVTYTTTTTSITFDIPLALVESWIFSPGANAGLAFIPSGTGGNSTTATLGNSFADEASRPLLSLSYTPVPEPKPIVSVLLGIIALFLMGKKRKSVLPGC